SKLGLIWVEFRPNFGIRRHLVQGGGRDAVSAAIILSPLPPRPRQRAAVAWNAAAPSPAEDLRRAAVPGRTPRPVGDQRRITPGGVARYSRERAPKRRATVLPSGRCSRGWNIASIAI